MLGFFTSNTKTLAKPEPSQLYPHPATLDDQDLIEFIRQVFPKNNPVIAALFLVALDNLPLRYSNFRKAMLKSNEYPASMDGLASFVLNVLAGYQGDSLDDEINSRRWFYFYVAALLTIAHDRAQKNPELWDGIADIWGFLMGGAHALRKTIDQTSLWNQHEVITFSEIQSEADGEKFVASELLPKELHQHERFRQWFKHDQQGVRDLFSFEGLFSDSWSFEGFA